jgi:hypothetical protein
MAIHLLTKLRRWRFRPGATLILAAALSLSSFCSLYAADTLPDGKQNAMDVSEPYVSATNGLGSWIWQEKTLNNQTCHFWKTVDVPEQWRVTKARLVLTTDNEFTLYLDGRELGRGVEWRELFVFDLSHLLTPGRHVLAVDCYNGSFFAGMLLGLRIDLAQGHTLKVKSDKSWRIVPDGVKGWETRTEPEPDWPTATIIAPLGGKPWWQEPEAVIMMPTPQPIRFYFWQTGWFQVSLISVSGLIILISLWLATQLTLHRKERYLLQGERARIARDIHDDIGARMTQLVLHGEVMQNELPADSEIRQELTWVCEEARGLLSTMDEILWAVNPRRDTLRDFADYVCNYAQEFLQPTRIQCLLAVDTKMPATAFNLPLRRSLLMAIKETLNNAVKHSEATELRLQIQWQSQRLMVVVQDNGKGFDRNAVKPGRNGLANMAERLHELGGNCVIVSQPGKGCRVEFNIPLKRPFRPFGWQFGIMKPFLGLNKEQDNAGTHLPTQNHDPTQC